ncbi:Mg-dependent DNase [Vibrio vulnificus]|uniref:Mg-dependent DNase n=3 Tax=Vibrio vulnificus TaxID=672 RepID=UPI0021D842D4|nr:Mg-dependent DNase [Vibrio vulnificus]
MFIKSFRDGFRGKPNFVSRAHARYRVDEHLYEFSFPDNYSSFKYYLQETNLDVLNGSADPNFFEHKVDLGFFSYRFHNVIINPIDPYNSQGLLLVFVRLKKVPQSFDGIESLNAVIEKEYLDFYHDPVPVERTLRGRHTEDMNHAFEYANKVWGEFPDSKEDQKEREEFLLDDYFRSFPPISCETVTIGKQTYSKYVEGDINYKHIFQRVYNLPLKDNYMLSFLFKYRLEGEASKKKFRKWLLSSDETFEHKILETLDISRLVDASTENEIAFISNQDEQ